MKINPISYDTTLTMPAGGYQHITHEQKNIGIHIGNKNNLKILLLTNIEMILDGSMKTVQLFNENDNFGLRFIDDNLDINSIILSYNLQDISSILEEKPVIKQVYDFIIDEGYYKALHSLITSGTLVEVYIYNVVDTDLFEQSFNKNMHKLLLDADKRSKIEPKIIFQLSDINYFDVFPLFENIEKNNYNVIPGCKINKFDIFVK